MICRISPGKRTALVRTPSTAPQCSPVGTGSSRDSARSCTAGSMADLRGWYRHQVNHESSESHWYVRLRQPRSPASGRAVPPSPEAQAADQMQWDFAGDWDEYRALCTVRTRKAKLAIAERSIVAPETCTCKRAVCLAFRAGMQHHLPGTVRHLPCMCRPSDWNQSSAPDTAESSPGTRCTWFASAAPGRHLQRHRNSGS
jgi:hypothetical protein